MKFQNSNDLEPKFVLQYDHNDKIVKRFIRECNISDAISDATSEIAGNTNNISDIPLTLVVKKHGVPSMTLIDLPGIVLNAFGDQPADIYERIKAIIMTYIVPEENIILNVMSACVNFTFNWSIELQRLVDITWKRTLAVITNCDLDPDSVYTKVTEDQLGIGLGYNCVRNKIGVESVEEARLEEAKLFSTHPLLSKLDKSVVGYERLANRITHLQGVIISKSLPKISDTINQRLDHSLSSLNKLPPKIINDSGAIIAYTNFSWSLKKALQNTLIDGGFNEYSLEKQINFKYRVAEMLEKFSKDLQSSVKFSDNFLNDEIKAVDKPEILFEIFPIHPFPSFFKSKLNVIKDLSISLVKNLWDCIQVVIVRVVNDQCKNYPQLTATVLTAVEHVMIRSEEKFLERVVERIKVERATQFTLNPDHMSRYKMLSGTYKEFLQAVSSNNSSPKFVVEGYGEIDVEHLSNVQETILQHAFDLKMIFTTYWELVIKQFLDWIAKFYLFQVKEVVIDEIDKEIKKELSVKGGCEKVMLKEAKSISEKRSSLEKNIKLLQELEEIIKQVMANTTEKDLKSDIALQPN